MALTPSTMLPLGTKAPAFKLRNVDGQMVSLDDFKSAPRCWWSSSCAITVRS